MDIPTFKEHDFLLRPLTQKDVTSVVEHGERAAFHRSTFTLFIPRTEEAARRWIRKNNRELKKKHPAAITFAIDVGAIEIFHMKNGSAEIGYWLAQEFTGRGIMRRAGRFVVNFSFTVLGLKRVYAQVISFDEASMRILKEEGFVKEKGGGQELFVKVRPKK